jgi:hypothetical protein
MVLEAIDLDNGRISSADGKPVFSGDLAVVKGARHVLPDGNRMTAVSFVIVVRECCRGDYGCKRCGWCH